MQTNFNFGWTIRAGQDLSAALYKAVNIAGTIASQAATAPTAAIGLLQSKPQSGEHAPVIVFGIAKGVAAGAINSGAAIAVTTSGFLAPYVAAGSGGNTAIGRALVSAASGDAFECAVNFINGGLAI